MWVEGRICSSGTDAEAKASYNSIEAKKVGVELSWDETFFYSQFLIKLC